MEHIETVRALQARADAERAAGRRIALVPTMGALHAGHASLFKIARQRADRVWVSIFVNPIQFDDPRDLAAYPRTQEADLAICRDAGVDLAFTPDATEMYPAGAQTIVEVSALAAPLCGASRPGHFRGVATVVAKLLAAAKPHVAVFGEKDYQQLAVIRQLVRDLLLDVEIVGAPTVREPDGLALSSRNRHLDAEARGQAVALVRALDAAESAVAAGEGEASRLLALVRAELAAAPRAEIDYAELRDPATLAPAPEQLTGPVLLALAVFMRPAPQVARSPQGREAAAQRGEAERSASPRETEASVDQRMGEGRTVRLIDNRVLHPPQVARSPQGREAAAQRGEAERSASPRETEASEDHQTGGVSS